MSHSITIFSNGPTWFSSCIFKFAIVQRYFQPISFSYRKKVTNVTPEGKKKIINRSWVWRFDLKNHHLNSSRIRLWNMMKKILTTKKLVRSVGLSPARYLYFSIHTQSMVVFLIFFFSKRISLDGGKSRNHINFVPYYRNLSAAKHKLKYYFFTNNNEKTEFLCFICDGNQIIQLHLEVWKFALCIFIFFIVFCNYIRHIYIYIFKPHSVKASIIFEFLISTTPKKWKPRFFLITKKELLLFLFVFHRHENALKQWLYY